MEPRSWAAGRIRVEPVDDPGFGLRAALFVGPVLGSGGDVKQLQLWPAECTARGLLGWDVQLLQELAIS